MAVPVQQEHMPVHVTRRRNHARLCWLSRSAHSERGHSVAALYARVVKGARCRCPLATNAHHRGIPAGRPKTSDAPLALAGAERRREHNERVPLAWELHLYPTAQFHAVKSSIADRAPTQCSRHDSARTPTPQCVPRPPRARRAQGVVGRPCLIFAAAFSGYCVRHVGICARKASIQNTSTRSGVRK